MSRPEKLERRLRIISFLFVAASIFLTFGSLVIASNSFDRISVIETTEGLTQQQIMVKIAAVVMTERFVNRCLLMAVLFMQLGILFLSYLVVGKLRRIEEVV